MRNFREKSITSKTGAQLPSNYMLWIALWRRLQLAVGRLGSYVEW